MSNERTVFTIVKPGNWGKVGDLITHERGVIEVRSKDTWLCQYHGRVHGFPERTARTRLIRFEIDWSDDDESCCVFGHANDMLLSYPMLDWSGFASLDTTFILVIDPGPCEVIAIFPIPCPFDVLEDEG